MSNTLTIVGNLTRDPELKFLDAGTAVARLSVAVTKKGFGDKPDKTSFVNVSLIGSIAENASASLKKGSRVIATGRMEQRTWDKEDGSKGEIWELNAEAIGPDLRFDTATTESKSYSAKGTAKATIQNYSTEDAF